MLSIMVGEGWIGRGRRAATRNPKPETRKILGCMHRYTGVHLRFDRKRIYLLTCFEIDRADGIRVPASGSHLLESLILSSMRSRLCPGCQRYLQSCLVSSLQKSASACGIRPDHAHRQRIFYHAVMPDGLPFRQRYQMNFCEKHPIPCPV